MPRSGDAHNAMSQAKGTDDSLGLPEHEPRDPRRRKARVQSLHHLNLDAIGGVECLFHDFIAASNSRWIAHNVFVTNKAIHKHLKIEIQEHAHSICYRKRWLGVRIPRFLRRGHELRSIAKVNPSVQVFWNQIGYHSDAPTIYYDHGASWTMDPRPSSRQFIENCHGVICCSKAAKRILELRLDIKNPIQVIRNPSRRGLDLNTASPKQLDINKPLRLGAAGRLIPLKGIALAIHATAILRAGGHDVQLSIAGSGNQKQSLEKLTRKLNIDRQVIFLGNLTDMPSFYRSLDIFLVPSLREPFGLVAGEALSFGCPVVCTRVDGLPEVVSHGKSGLCVPAQLPLSEYQLLGGSMHGLPKHVYDPERDSLSEPRAADPSDLANAIAQASQPDVFAQMSNAAIHAAQNEPPFSRYVDTIEQRICGTVNM